MNFLGKVRINAAPGMIWLAALCFAMVLASCASMPKGSVKATQYRSADAVILKLGEATSPEVLAKEYLGDAANAWVIADNNRESNYAAGEVVIIPLRYENKGGLHADGVQVVPILCYHRFAEKCDSNLCLSKDSFTAQMAYLKQNGYQVISLAQLQAFLEYRSTIPAKSVVLTMDDAYRSIYDIAYPILKQYGFTATLFVYTEFVQSTSIAMTWDQLREMKAAGFEIGSHSISHPDLTLKKDGEDEQTFLARVTRELIHSKKILDGQLKQDTVFFAYPYGIYDQQVVQLTQRAGYGLGLGIQYGGNPFFADPMTLKRNQILSEDFNYFKKRINTIQQLSLRVSHAD